MKITVSKNSVLFPEYKGSTVHLNSQGEIHRDKGPAIIGPDGTKEWRSHGKIHRVGGPAIVFRDGTKEWWENDACHREGGPAIVRKNGINEWYFRGVQLVIGNDIVRGYGRNDFCYQEFICRNRPDLIDDIPNLVEELERKYQHELELAKVDV